MEDIKLKKLTQGTDSNLAIASGYEMKASPVPPDLTTSLTSTPILCAKFPKIPKIIVPAKRDVNVSKRETTSASLVTEFLSFKSTWRALYFHLHINIVPEAVV